MSNILLNSGNNTLSYNGTNYVINGEDCTFPVTLTNNTDSIAILNFETDIQTTNQLTFFIIYSNNITINGNNNKVELINVMEYSGLCQNGTSDSEGKSNVIVKNVNVISTGSALSSQNGWICQSYFSKNASECQINNCSSDGPISELGGGIVGSYANYGSSSTLSIENCFSTGIINSRGGGIVGSYANSGSSGTLSIQNCCSTGIINIYGGGILGSNANDGSSGTIIIKNCYSTGIINQSGGGIYGFFANNAASGNCIALCCYSKGNIVGTNSGGIYSSQTNNASENIDSHCVAVNCYSTGDISGAQTGGIFGYGANYAGHGYCKAVNCYSTGAITGTNSGGVFGLGANNSASGYCEASYCYTSGSGTSNGIFSAADANGNDNLDNDAIIGTYNYSEANHMSSGWNDSHATYSVGNQYSLLMSIDSIDIWLKPNISEINIPFLLLAFNDSLYSDTYQATINIGSITTLSISNSDAGVWYTNDNSVIVSNNEATIGQLTSENSGTYNIYVINGSGDSILTIYGYNINKFELTVRTNNNINTNNNMNNSVLFKLINTKNKKYIRRIKNTIIKL